MASKADQLPGCIIPDNCMTDADQGCDGDLKCICRIDNHLGTNKLFSSDCLLKECSDGHGRKSFLRDWLESCREACKSGWDQMPWEWELYLPDDGEIVIRPSSFLNAPAVITSVRGPPPSVVPVVTSTAGVATSIEVLSPSAASGLKTTLSTSVTTSVTNSTTRTSSEIVQSITTAPILNSNPEATSPPPAPITVTSHSLSPGAIGGIVAGILALAILCAGLGYFYWKSNKKAKRKTREVAILSDRVSGCGFQKYIDDLLADSNSDSHGYSNSSTGTIVRHPTPPAGSGPDELQEKLTGDRLAFMHAPISQEEPKPALSVAAIIGFSVGGAVLLALVVGLVAWILRRRKRNQFPRAVSPPFYEVTDVKKGCDKPELDGQVMGYQYSKAEVDAPAQPPIVYAELDGGSRSVPVQELSGRF
ncbi:hypothetical protein E8E11_008563 [Didymella keratinophila]|nr:hypothetical protein E8E11_008563 [Didymella keratinophila]